MRCLHISQRCFFISEGHNLLINFIISISFFNSYLIPTYEIMRNFTPTDWEYHHAMFSYIPALQPRDRKYIYHCLSALVTSSAAPYLNSLLCPTTTVDYKLIRHWGLIQRITMELSRTEIVFRVLTAVFVVAICIVVPIAIANSVGSGASKATANGNKTANGTDPEYACLFGCGFPPQKFK